jgi:Tfp pilus assembly protein PilX
MNSRLKRIINSNYRDGFALPTVLVASLIMLTVLLVAVASTATISTSLNSQYYNQLARTAGEAGVAYANSCLANNGGIPQWTDAKPLKPDTDCTGTQLSTSVCPATATDPCHFVMINGTINSSFSVGLPTLDSGGKAISIPSVGRTNLLRSSDSSVWRQYTQLVYTSYQTLPNIYGSQSYTTPGTYTFTVPAGVTQVTFIAVGGGGGGGAGGGGGGGAGGTYTGTLTVTPAQQISTVVGSGGLGIGNSDGGIGGNSSFGSYIAHGGGGGGYGYGGSGAGGIGGIGGGLGGDGSNGSPQQAQFTFGWGGGNFVGAGGNGSYGHDSGVGAGYSGEAGAVFIIW